ncbi:MAG: type IV pilus assembly protein PilM [Patescibacteria group bacterium]|nr:type IV pilus assembly protein PilM [Patescibacteria group bacterium]MDD4304807.1 type IV pilus assembly protein PilM [Patescibacteria group bacterium]MDD4695863.1 type IV pilus assembly protein PilM [Patescibacteria group bacterium]
MLFINSSNYPIGLDISDLSLKFLQLKKNGDKIKIQSFGKIELEKEIIRDGEILNKKEFIKSIKKLLSQPKFGKITSSEFVICLPEQKTFIKLLSIDKNLNNFEETLEEELKKQIPIPIEDIYYDWQLIQERDDKKLILLGASPKNFVNQYLEIFKECKLSVVAMEIESTAISRALLMEENPKYKKIDTKNYIILDIGAKRSSIFIYSKNTILFNLSIPISGEEISEKIAKNLKINPKQAELAKIVCGLDDDKCKNIIKKILSNTINELILKINNIIDFYTKNYENRGIIDQIILSGGGANIKNLDKIIQENTKIQTILGDSSINFYNKQKFQKHFIETHKLKTEILNIKNKNQNNTENISTTQNSNLEYTTAIGLALRNIFLE